jgi:hypothetical protein
VSQYPRYITAAPGVTVSWGEPACSFFLRFGTVLDCPPGSALETAIGTQNLSAVIPVSDPRRSPDGGGPNLSKAALSN